MDIVGQSGLDYPDEQTSSSKAASDTEGSEEDEEEEVSAVMYDEDVIKSTRQEKALAGEVPYEEC